MSRPMSKHTMHCKCGKQLAVKPAVVYCPECGTRMAEEGFHFFDHMRIINLHQSKSKRGVYENRGTGDWLPYYVFNLSIGGIIINGCTYKPLTGAVIMPSIGVTKDSGPYRKCRAVKLFPAVAKRIRCMLDEEIKEAHGNGLDEQEAA